MTHRTRYKNPVLAAALARNGMTGQRLASLSGISPVTVSALLNKRRDPKPETATAISRTLGLSPEELGWEVPR